MSFQVNVLTESDPFSFIMSQRHHLGKHKMRRTIDRIKGFQTLKEDARHLNISQSVTLKASIRLVFSPGIIDRQLFQWTQRAKTVI